MKRPFVLGLTGSIGMGKSTTAQMFSDMGIPVWDADAVVHRLYERGGAGVETVRALCPDCIVEGAVDRTHLKKWLAGNLDNLKALETPIHKLVAQDRERFISASEAPIILLDIPLLFEVGAEQICDAVAVVSVPEAVQRARVLSRDGMTEALFKDILARQIPDPVKRERADYIIDTQTLEGARKQMQDVLRDIGDKINARNRAGHGNDGIRP